jgi:uncharacterized protein DUF6390
MDGVALAARFSIATNRLQFCGPADAEPVLYRAILRDQGDPASRGALGKFEALMPYFEAIAAKHGLDPFDRAVTEAYWIGNSLLDPFTPADFRRILTALVRRGLPESLAGRLADHLPARPLPHHVFHVGFVGVGAVTGHVATTLANTESCRPTPAYIRAVTPGGLELDYTSLAVDGPAVHLGPSRTLTAPFDAKVLGAVQPGDWVALHWQWPALRLSTVQREALEQYTQLSLAAANEAYPALLRPG